MTHTFDIRFARSAGLAAFLEAPENRFHWKGGGLLRIDAQSISFTVKRSLFALLGGRHTQRIPTGHLRAVYREGEALRVEYQAPDATRVVLPFWAGDRDIAEQIVRLLPTSQTVEIEHAIHSVKRRADWRVLLSLGVVVLVIAAGSWAVYQPTHVPVMAASASASDRAAPVEVLPFTPDSTTSAVDTTAPPVSPTKSRAQRVEAPAFPLDTSRTILTTRPISREPTNASEPSIDAESPTASGFTSPAAASAEAESQPAGRVRMTSEGVVPIVPGMPTYEVARRQLDLFLAESNTLRGYYQDARYAANTQRFGEIGRLWWKVTVRVNNSLDLEDPALRHLQEIELAVSRAWRRAFSYYGDPALLVVADAEIEFAEMLEARARQFVQ